MITMPVSLDIQSNFDDCLSTITNKKDTYLNSKQFLHDKMYFQEALREVETKEVELLSQEKYNI